MDLPDRLASQDSDMLVVSHQRGVMDQIHKWFAVTRQSSRRTEYLWSFKAQVQKIHQICSLIGRDSQPQLLELSDPGTPSYPLFVLALLYQRGKSRLKRNQFGHALGIQVRKVHANIGAKAVSYQDWLLDS